MVLPLQGAIHRPVGALHVLGLFDPRADDASSIAGQLFDLFVGGGLAALGHVLPCGLDKRRAIEGGGAEVQVAARCRRSGGAAGIHARRGAGCTTRRRLLSVPCNWMRERSSRCAKKADCGIGPTLTRLRASLSHWERVGVREQVTRHLPPERFFEDGEGGQGVAFGGGEAGQQVVEEVGFPFVGQPLAQRGIVQQGAQGSACA